MNEDTQLTGSATGAADEGAPTTWRFVRSQTALRRRIVLLGGAPLPVGASVVLPGACDESDDAPASCDASASQEAAESAEGTGDAAPAEGFPISDVPVGESAYDKASNTVFSQPTEGDFRAFDATCPHQGCAVSDFADGRLLCPCHGSMFDPDSGDVLGGPATSGLTVKDVTVSGDDLLVT
ncbi:Rieske (2Fe-2S) protein [soil metagenome]